jgi:hypothetical protein
MNNCSYCNSLILFGGRKVGDYSFCNDRCAGQAQAMLASRYVPADVVEKVTKDVHEGECPRCRGRGPVDIHTSHSVWSALLLTSWKSKPVMCCRSCGLKNQVLSGVGSAVFGWWGFPWGLLLTPVQIFRNIYEAFTPPDATKPSEALKKHVAMSLATRMVEARAATTPPSPQQER